MTSAAFAQTIKSDEQVKEPLMKHLWEIAQAKGSIKPFIVLTPTDLSVLSIEEKNLLTSNGDPCNVSIPINLGQTVDGSLAGTDCRLDDNSYADFYSFNGIQGQIVDVRLNSSVFDTYLGLANESGTFTREDDDGGGGTNSRIVATLPQTGLYIILANSVLANQFGAYSLSLNEIINCTYSVTPTSTDIPAAGGTFSVSITTQNGCQWTARTNNTDFITVNNASGTGSSNISYTVAQNGSGLSRGGALIINNSIVVQIQQPTLQCNFVLTPGTANFPMSGGTGSINISVQSGCVWNVFSNNGFITASGSGSGNGTVNYSVAANSGADRSGSLRIGSSAPVYFYINQLGFNCITNVSPIDIVAGKTGKTGTIFVTSNCSWTVVVNDPFLQVTTTSGTGSGSFNYRVLANDTGSRRVGSIRVLDGQNSDLIFFEQRGVTYQTKFDFNSDGRSDLAVFRPSNRTWYVRQNEQIVTPIQMGLTTDKIVPADFNGDGITDITVWRPSTGVWFFHNIAGMTAVQFGMEGDIPVPADYDGDGLADVAVFRPSNGVWYVRTSSNDGFYAVQFGIAEDIPTIGDFDGDGKSDIAVWRPSVGDWYRLNSSNGTFSGLKFGLNIDKPTPGDFDGDGKTDIAVWRPSDRVWYRLNSSDNSFSAVQFGAAEDIPVPGDYDGDQKTDVAVFRPSDGNWYLLNSSSGFSVIHFGLSGDLPIQNAFIRQ